MVASYTHAFSLLFLLKYFLCRYLHMVLYVINDAIQVGNIIFTLELRYAE